MSHILHHKYSTVYIYIETKYQEGSASLVHIIKTFDSLCYTCVISFFFNPFLLFINFIYFQLQPFRYSVQLLDAILTKLVYVFIFN